MTPAATQSHPAPGEPRSPGLHSLASVVLDSERQAVFEAARRCAGGGAAWRQRKLTEARELLALSQVAPGDRLTVEYLELTTSLRAMLRLRVPVPCRPDEHGLRLEDAAILGLTYPQEAVSNALPGWAFVQILQPLDVWLPNVAHPVQHLCLAPSLPAGVRVRSLVLLSFGALSLSLPSVQVDERDPAGLFDLEAARWWQQHLHLAPLTRVPFLGRDPASDGGPTP